MILFVSIYTTKEVARNADVLGVVNNATFFSKRYVVLVVVFLKKIFIGDLVNKDCI